MTLPLNRLDEFSTPEDAARFNMIEQQIRPWLVDDLNVLEALKNVKREAYVPEPIRSLAFMDIELPLLGEQDALAYPDRAMLAPKVEARFLNDLKIQAHERVLEVGAGSGYMAALLASQAKEVVTLEIHAPLVDVARENLARNHVNNVTVVHADASNALPDGQFDVIVISGAVSEVPAALLDRLAEGGRFIGVVGGEPIMQVTLIERKKGALLTRTDWDFKTPLLQNFPKPSEFRF